MKTATTTGQNNNKVSSKKQTIKATTSAVTSSLFSKLLLLVLGKPLKIGESQYTSKYVSLGSRICGKLISLDFIGCIERIIHRKNVMG